MTEAFTQVETNSLSLAETLSLPSTPSISQTPTTIFPPNFPTNLDDRYKELLTNNIPPTIRLEYIRSTHSIIWSTP